MKQQFSHHEVVAGEEVLTFKSLKVESARVRFLSQNCFLFALQWVFAV